MIKNIFIILTGFLISCNSNANPDFSFFYIANINGNLENCDCGNPSLGGLDRIAKIIQDERNENPEVLFIDGGLTLNSYPFPELDSSILRVYNYLKPDIWLVSQKDSDKIESLNDRVSLLGLNYHLLNTDSLQQIKKIEIADKKINFYSLAEIQFIDFSVFKKIDRNTFNILIFSSAREHNFTGKPFDYFDLVLLADNQQVITRTETKPAILGVGADGQYLAKVDLFADGTDYRIKFSSIDIEKELESDSTVNSIIQDFLKKIKQTNGA